MKFDNYPKTIILYGIENNNPHYNLNGFYFFTKFINEYPAYKFYKSINIHNTKTKPYIYKRKKNSKWMVSAKTSIIRESGWLQSLSDSDKLWEQGWSQWEKNGFYPNKNIKFAFINTDYHNLYDIIKSNENMLENNTFSDITFILKDGTEIKAHKCILASRSQYFNTLLNSQFQEAIINKIYIEDNISEKSFKILLNFIYTSNFKDLFIDTEELVSLLLLSKQYCLDKLVNMCINLCIKKINIENIIPWLLLAYNINFPALKKKCIDIVKFNFISLICTKDFMEFINNNENIWNNIVENMQNNKDNIILKSEF